MLINIFNFLLNIKTWNHNLPIVFQYFNSLLTNYILSFTVNTYFRQHHLPVSLFSTPSCIWLSVWDDFPLPQEHPVELSFVSGKLCLTENVLLALFLQKVSLSVNSHNSSFIHNRIKGKHSTALCLSSLMLRSHPSGLFSTGRLFFLSSCISPWCFQYESFFYPAWNTLGFLNLRLCCLSPNLKIYQPLSL